MESSDTRTGQRPEDVPPPAAQGSQPGDDGPLGAPIKPAPHLRTTRGGAGATAGATPKKAYRPSVSSRSRPAGKKPDHGPD